MIYTMRTNDTSIDVTIKVTRGAVEVVVSNPEKSNELEDGITQAQAEGEIESRDIALPLPRPSRPRDGTLVGAEVGGTTEEGQKPIMGSREIVWVLKELNKNGALVDKRTPKLKDVLDTPRVVVAREDPRDESGDARVVAQRRVGYERRIAMKGRKRVGDGRDVINDAADAPVQNPFLRSP